MGAVIRLAVCFPLSRFEAGGLERVQMHIAAGLIQAGISAHLVTRHVDVRAYALQRADVPLHALGSGRLAFMFRLSRWLQENEPAVIVTSATDIGCFVLLLRRLFWPRSRVIWAQHLSIAGPLRTSKGVRRVRLLLEVWLMRGLIKHAEAVVAVSSAVADDMQRTIGSDLDIRIIHNPVISNDFEEMTRQEIEWPWQDRAVPTIVFVGRLAPVKRLDLLLRAFARDVQAMPARLLIVGDGREWGAAKELASVLQLGESCRFVGHRDNPLPWIRQADLLVLCSDAEGFGLVLVEAMACGTQVVATDCPYGPEEVLENGRYGRLVPVDDAGALASAIRESLRSPLATEAELKARAAEFTVERAIVKYVDLVKEVAGASR